AGEQRADLRLHRNPVLFPAPVVVHVHGNDAYTHRFFLRVPFSGADAAVSAWGLVPGIGGVAVRQYAIELQAEPAGFDDRLGATVDVERAQDGRDVNLDSAFGQAQFAADHLVRFALKDQREDLRLTLGEAKIAGSHSGRRTLALLRRPRGGQIA